MGKNLGLGGASYLINFSALNDWLGFRYHGISSLQDSSLFTYCIIEKGNANGIGNYANGGAFFISYFSKIRIENCIVSNNYAYIDGGAFYCDHANPIITGDTIINNTANSYYGGGIYCHYSSPTITNNTFYSNVGTICCRYSSPVIRSNSITYTTVNVAIFCEYSSPQI